MVFTNSNRFAVIYRFACFILIGIFVVACQSLPGAKKPAKKDPVVETQQDDATTEPPLELIPFGNSIAGAALSVLGLGMMARDGALIIVALLFIGALAYLVGRIWL